jgi:mRNA interferase MazF
VFEPDAGDLIWTDFDPQVGREQGGRRPAVVVSPLAFFRASAFVIVCPITSRVRPFASSVVLPARLPVAGEVLTSQGAVRRAGRVARQARGADGDRIAGAVSFLHGCSRNRDGRAIPRAYRKTGPR